MASVGGRASLASKPAWLLLPLAALVWVQVAGVPSTNLGGFDEWLVLDLVSRGVLASPYANRPFDFLWFWPASRLPGYGFGSFGLLFALYSWLGAWLVWWICRKVAPCRPLMAAAAAAFFVVWYPGDLARLGAVDRAHYSGVTLGALLSVALLLEAWARGSRAFLALGILVTIVVGRGYEGTLGLLAGAPLLLWASRKPGRRTWLWALVWEGGVAVVALLVAAPILGFRPANPSYQGSVLGLSAGPATWLLRIGWQYVYHLLPLVTSSPSELLAWKAPVSAALLAVGLLGASRAGDPAEPDRELWTPMLAGLVFAALGYSLVVLGMSRASAYRLEFLAGPGISVFLASVVCLIGRLFGPRWRLPVTVALAGWIVAVGAGRLVAMQGTWEDAGAYPRQSAMLRGLTRVVPDVKAGTIVVVLDEGAAWKANFTFEHAVRYLYQGRAAGCVWKGWAFLYHTSFVPAGVRFEPLAEIREAWRVPLHTYRYDEVVVVRFTGAGEVEVLGAWPDALPPLPEGARYDPASRILRDGPPVPERAVLSQG